MSRWPKLSETLPPAINRDTCQACGRTEAGDAWIECDDRDQQTEVAVVVCRQCAKTVITPHPRLYVEVQRDAPKPGLMAACTDCVWRKHLQCMSPLLRANGGAGLPVKYPQPTDVHMNFGGGKGRFMKLYRGAPTCEGRSLPTEQLLND